MRRTKRAPSVALGGHPGHKTKRDIFIINNIPERNKRRNDKI